MAKDIKKVGVRLVFAWIFSVLFILSGVGLLFNSPLSGILMLVAGVFILPPFSKMLKEKANLEISTWLKIIIVLVLLVIVGTMMSTDTIDTNNNLDDNNAGLDNPQNQEEETQSYSFNDEIIVGTFTYIFHDYTTRSYVGSEYFKEEADGIYLIFDVTIENIGDKSEHIWGSYVTVIDDQGRRFEHDTTAEIYADDSFSFEQMQPGLPKRGKIIFDVPEEMGGYIEISSNSIWSDEVKFVSWDN